MLFADRNDSVEQKKSDDARVQMNPETNNPVTQSFWIPGCMLPSFLICLHLGCKLVRVPDLEQVDDNRR